MPDCRRSRNALITSVLALPILLIAYLAIFWSRSWAALRPMVATMLGATVIGVVYADEAMKRTTTPVRAAAVLALAVALAGPAVAPAPVAAGYDPAEAVIAAGMRYVGQPFRLGSEGPRFFDCSGFIYRIFSDAGELPRIGGLRLRAAGYTRWFIARDRYGHIEPTADRGDLVAYTNGKRISHIGIYLGNGKVLSALTSGVTVHRLNGVSLRVAHFLSVNWGGGDGTNGDVGEGDGNTGGNANGSDRGNPDIGSPRTDTDQPTTDPSPGDDGPARPQGWNALATGTMNLRIAADPEARAIGWIGRSAYFKVLDRGTSPAGYLWFKVETRSGKTGWVYSRWVRQLAD